MPILHNDVSSHVKSSLLYLFCTLALLAFSSQAEVDTKDNQVGLESKMFETIQVPDNQVRYYGMMIKTRSGVRGRIFINDVEVEKYDVEGAQISSNQPQCFLRVGKNSLKIDLQYIDANTVNDDEPLIKLDLHAMDEPDFPNKDNLFFSINWSPEKAGEKTYNFVLAENQGPVRTAICD